MMAARQEAKTTPFSTPRAISAILAEGWGSFMNGIRNAIGGIVAALLLFALASLFWFAQIDWVARPAVRAASAPSGEFSAERAEAVLARILGPEKPHPVSTDENAAVRARIVKELGALGVPTSIHHGLGCNAVRNFGVLMCA